MPVNSLKILVMASQALFREKQMLPKQIKTSKKKKKKEAIPTSYDLTNIVHPVISYSGELTPIHTCPLSKECVKSF